VSVYNGIPELELLSDKVMVFFISITRIAIMISSTMFMELRHSQNWSAVRFHSEDSIRDTFRLL